MCNGREEQERNEYLSAHKTIKETNLCMDDHGSEFDSAVYCELCDSEASIYCQADDAFLCRKCDTKVHAVNFIAQRHIRCFLCTTCRTLTHTYLIGDVTQVILPTIVRKKDSHADDKSSVVEPNYFIRPTLFL